MNAAASLTLPPSCFCAPAAAWMIALCGGLAVLTIFSDSAQAAALSFPTLPRLNAFVAGWSPPPWQFDTTIPLERRNGARDEGCS